MTGEFDEMSNDDIETRFQNEPTVIENNQGVVRFNVPIQRTNHY